jgi:hypothetical protein
MYILVYISKLERLDFKSCCVFTSNGRAFLCLQNSRGVTARGFRSANTYLVWFNIISGKVIWSEITRELLSELV